MLDAASLPDFLASSAVSEDASVCSSNPHLIHMHHMACITIQQGRFSEVWH
jgi:hypothetical protein